MPLPTYPVLICLLGPFQVLVAGRPLAVHTGGKIEALLRHLALRPVGGVARDTLVESLWPASLTVLARQSLTSLIYSLHDLIGEGLGGAALVRYSHGAYHLNGAAGVGVDAHAFEVLTQTGEQLAREGARAAAMDAFAQAVTLYRGDLSAGDDLHALVAREHLRARYLTLLAWLAEACRAAGDDAAGLAHARLLLAHDPCREDAHRLVMRCHVRLGERAQALRQYRLCEEVLRLEFAARPEPATILLYERVRDDPGSV
jgi:DNA-binding SARP family transcriptional activator